MRNLVRVVLSVYALSAVIPSDYAGSLPTRDTQYNDALDQANIGVGTGSTAFDNGEAVDTFTGNLRIIHPTSPQFPVEGGGSFGLTRVYNSASVRNDVVKQGAQQKWAVRGVGWVGLGWKAHLGRFFAEPEYVGGGTPPYRNHKHYFEMPDGSLVRVRWNETERRFKNNKVAHPDILVTFQPACPQSAPGGGSPPPAPPVDPEGEAGSCCQLGDCDKMPFCGAPPGDPCVGRPAGVAYYELIFPGGTKYHLEEIVAPQIDSTSGYRKNVDRAGWYPTKIVDPFGNYVAIEYRRIGEFPEAITRISSSSVAGSAEITTTLCTSGDVETARCPASALGALKTVTAIGFRGTRSAPQFTTYDYYYDEAVLPDGINGTAGVITVPLLKEVRLTGSAGSQGGSSLYAYGSADASAPGFGPLLERVTYPLGASSTFGYGNWVSGSRGQASAVLDRYLTGVVSRAAYPDGLPAAGESAVNQAKWAWVREFRRTNGSCSGGPATSDANSYTITDPLGMKTRTRFGGHVCGDTPVEGDNQWGVHGVPMKITVLGPNGTTEVRTVDVKENVKREVGINHPIKMLVESVATTFHDDLGNCFSSGTGGEPRQVETINVQRNVNHWEQTYVQNRNGVPGYFPVRGAAPTSQLTSRSFQAPSECSSALNLQGLPAVVKTTQAGQTSRRSFVWTCEGRLGSDTSYPDWNGAGPLGTEVTKSYTYSSLGDLIAERWSGGQNYGNGQSGNAYGIDYETDRGVPVRSTLLNLPGGYKSTDITIDGSSGQAGSGRPWRARDANGFETAVDFDDLGRMITVTPPSPVVGTKLVYDGLSATGTREVRTIVGASGVTTFSPGDKSQAYSDVQLDRAGRAIRQRRAAPDGTLSLQMTGYDVVGRAVFVSAWMSEAEYAAATKIDWVADANGDGTNDTKISGVPLSADGKVRGVTSFYGQPLTNGAGNPLKITPDPLGRLIRVERAGELVSETTYCGMHQQVVTRADTDADGTAENVTSRYYHDGLGRLVLVDAPTGSADAEYSYDPLGNLTKVVLIPQLPANPFAAWLAAPIDPTGGQVREFSFDAMGRMISRSLPEEDADSASGNNITRYYDAWDNWGNLLRWRDALGIKRGYYFRNFFDQAGRLTRSEKVRGTPAATDPTDENLLASSGQDDGSFETGTTGWQFGTLDSNWQFSTASSDWHLITFGTSGACNIAAAPLPGGGSNTKALYFGDATGCKYNAVGSGRQALRRLISGVPRDAVLSLQYWRQMREALPDKDAFTAFIVPANAATNDMSARRVAFRIDGGQDSFARWQRVFDVRPGDLFSGQGSTEWPDDGSTRSFYLLLVMEKGDSSSNNIGTGMLIDNIFLGRRGVEKLAEFKYDETICGSGAVTPTTLSQACQDGPQSSDKSKGKLTTALGYQSGVAVARDRMVYRGLNGQLSGREQALDFTGAQYLDQNAGTARWVSRYLFDNLGQLSTFVAPYQPGSSNDYQRYYNYSYNRGAIETLGEGVQQINLLSVDPLTQYGALSQPLVLRFANHTEQTFQYDPLNQLLSIRSTGPADQNAGQAQLWASGNYRIDPSGNITAIGNQRFRYDQAGRLSRAEMIPQSSQLFAQAPQDRSDKEIQDFAYDPFGNMTSSTATAGGPVSDPVGLSFNFGYSAKNRVSATNNANFTFEYDRNGNTTRFGGRLDQQVAAFWSPLNQLSLFYEGNPSSSSGRPGEIYLYDSSSLRFLRQTVGTNGQLEFELRDTGGSLVSRFLQRSADSYPTLDRDYVYGLGRQLLERKVTAIAPVGSVIHPLSGSGVYNLSVSSGAGSYAIDLSTPSGWTNYLPVVTADTSGNFTIAESELKPGEVNFVRIRKDGTNETGYSAPLALIYDPSVTSSTPNQVRAIGVSRSGTNVTIRWSLLTQNNKPLRLYFRRADGTATYLLTPSNLPSTTTNLTLDSQSLAAPCGSFFLTQVLTGGESGESAKADLPSPQAGLGGRQPCGSTGGGPGGSGLTSNYSWLNYSMHRDHLSSLRVVTDDAGRRLEGLDFYAYGLEMPLSGALGWRSRAKYTVHDRDEGSGSDYMLMRGKPIRFPFFSTIDPASDTSRQSPISWNKGAYVQSSPMTLIDPLGLVGTKKYTRSTCLADGGIWDKEKGCGFNGGHDWQWWRFTDQGGVSDFADDINSDLSTPAPSTTDPWTPRPRPEYPAGSYLAYQALGLPTGAPDYIDEECFLDYLLENIEASHENWYGMPSLERSAASLPVGMWVGISTEIPGPVGTTATAFFRMTFSRASFGGNAGVAFRSAFVDRGITSTGQAARAFGTRAALVAFYSEMGLLYGSLGYSLATADDRCRDKNRTK